MVDINDVIKESLSDIEYDKIILFGSRAKNNFNKNSDYDLLIIINKEISDKEKIQLSTCIRRRLAKKMIDADIIVKNTNDINYYKDKLGSIVRTAINEGIVL